MKKLQVGNKDNIINEETPVGRRIVMANLTLEIFARRLKRMREDRNLTTRELGEIIGTSHTTISRYETGKRDPDIVLARNIAKHFGVSIEYMCGEDVDGADVDKLIEMYSKLSDDGRNDVMKYTTYVYEKER